MSEYPTTAADLQVYDRCKDLHMRSRDARIAAVSRLGLTDIDVAAILGCTEGEVQNIYNGADRIETDHGVTPIMEATLPAKAIRLFDNFARLLRASEVLPARRAPEPAHEAVAGLQHGVADALVVANLRTSARGHNATFGARNANAVVRVQTCTQYGVTPASLGEAAGCPAKVAYDWMTGASVPGSDAVVEMERIVSFLMTGPFTGDPGRKTKTAVTF